MDPSLEFRFKNPSNPAATQGYLSVRQCASSERSELRLEGALICSAMGKSKWEK